MPNDNTAVCGCGVVLDLPKSSNGMTAIPSRNFTILIPKSSKGGGKKSGTDSERSRGPNSRAADSGSTSSVAEQATRSSKGNKKDRRINSARRTRSAERAESHYTYIGE